VVAGWWGLGEAIGHAWSALVVTLILAVIAAVLAMMGRSAFAAAKGLPQTTDTVRRIPDALTPNPENRRLPTMTPTRSAPKLSAPRNSLSSNVNALAYEAKRFGDQGVRTWSVMASRIVRTVSRGRPAWIAPWASTRERLDQG
jgi:Putative Actinobacterial Holin-X, holin superfamily III